MRLFTIICLLMLIDIAAPLHAEDFLAATGNQSPLKNRNARSSVYELQNTFHEIYSLYRDSVVFISTEKTIQIRDFNPFFEDPFFRDFLGPRPDAPGKKQKKKGLGTGFILSADGYICTNHHVVANMDSVTVLINDKTYKAKIIGSDALTDIALIKIEGNNRFTPAYLGNSAKVKVGDLVFAIGNPFGLDKTCTFGVISATGRQDLDMPGNAHIQTDASINPGNSGGPLINLDGEVIGVNRMIYSRTGGSLGIGFAIPVNTARDTLIQLKKSGKILRGFIGVQIAPLTEEFAKKLGLESPDGALVAAVIKNSPADAAGIKIKDVITQINKNRVRSFRDLFSEINRSPIGSSIPVTVWRDKKSLTFTVTIREKPDTQ